MMATVLPVVRIVLAAAFLTSCLAKLLDPAVTRRSLRDFGVPGRLVGIGAIALPVLELLIAAGLAAAPTARVAAAAALVLVAVFTAAIGYQLARGRNPRCNCFGAMSGKTVGKASLIRNAILIAAAVSVLTTRQAQSGPNVARWLMDTGPAERLILAVGGATLTALLLMGHALAQLRRQQQRILTLVENLQTSAELQSGGTTVRPLPAPMPATRAAPAFQLADISRAPTSLTDLLATGRGALLLFVNPRCGPCDATLALVSSWRMTHHDLPPIAVITQGTAPDNQDKVLTHALRPVLLQRDREVAEAYGVHGTPCMVAIGSNGRTTGPPAHGQHTITQLLTTMTSRAVSTSAESPALAQADDDHG